MTGYSNATVTWNHDEATLTQNTGWNGNYGSDSTRNYVGIYLQANKVLDKAKFKAGDVITLEYEYKNNSNITKDIVNYMCYGAGYCSQGVDGNYANPGQTESYHNRQLRFENLNQYKTIESDYDCPDGSTPDNGWCTYSDTLTVTNDLINGCINDNNPSGYCLREMGIALRGDVSLQDDVSEKINVRNVRIRLGCRNNNECSGNDNFCEPSNIGNDLRYCVDDYDNGIGYFSFNHTYICSNPNKDYPHINEDGYKACVYQPKVYVEDNWGFCSKGSGVACVDFNGDIQGWENYGGEIILIP